jgi:hypothetical protein
MTTETIWLAFINYQGDTDCVVRRSEQSAKAMVADFARTWWEAEDVPGTFVDKTDDEVIEMYFEHMEGTESYNIAELELED